MTQIKKFTNSRFDVLEYLYEHKDGNNVARVTQSEIADSIDISRPTINKFIAELKEDGFINETNRYLEYILTQKAIVLVSGMKTTAKRMNSND